MHAGVMLELERMFSESASMDRVPSHMEAQVLANN